MRRRDRSRLVTEAARAETEFELERITRLSVLEALYARRKLELHDPGIFVNDLEDLVDQPREHLHFTVWYLIQKAFVQRADNSRLVITAEGVDYLEANYQQRSLRTRLLEGSVEPSNHAKEAVEVGVNARN